MKSMSWGKCLFWGNVLGECLISFLVFSFHVIQILISVHGWQK